MHQLMEQYHDTPMDLADASLVATAETLNLTRIFTMDSDFYVYRGSIFRYIFGGNEPVGSYVWLGAFTAPGTLNIIGDIAQAPFTFSP